jgi:hypothetical protein
MRFLGVKPSTEDECNAIMSVMIPLYCIGVPVIIAVALWREFQ